MRSGRSIRLFAGLIGRALTLTASLALVGGCASTPAGASIAPSAAVTMLPTTGATSSLRSAAPSTVAADGQIAFVKVETGRGQIYVERADGTAVLALAPSEFDDESPALSPDGRKVAFARNTADGSTASGTFVVNVDGTGLKQIDTNGEDPAWSPDGSQLVETRALVDEGAATPYNVGLWVVTVDTGRARQITRKGVRCPNACANGGQDGEARWSPDGKRLTFLRETYTSPEQFSIFTAATDGTDIKRVTPAGMDVGDPHWSPDGTVIVFQSPPDPSEHYAQNVYTIHPDGSHLTQLTAGLPSSPSGLQGAAHPCFSPDGREIVFARFPGSGPDGASLFLNGASLFVMNADGPDSHLLGAPNLDENAPEWGPSATSG